ncbi:hypothetical protein CC78DRAFT_527935 [Lojkania enalia]|uniref:Myb-like domain-containing protein n=1 Tax=Lojkania enalia TaxID=147567 RepID=A0A9P4ND82_9PLEO|nr:hypothetical protein CC78DRAFT_527935 [Didymosphaeria enalia]
MPKADRTPTHRHSIASAAGGHSGVRGSSWSTKDDETLIAARAQGLNWNQIAPKYFPSKSANACRKRHERLMERQNAEQWDGGIKLDVLAQAYMEVRREMWGILAARVNEKWQLVEQKCMEKGLKNLNQAYRSSQRNKGTYDSHDDSGVGGISDLEEESDDRHGEMHDISETSPQYPGAYSQRGLSIQSMLTPHSQYSSSLGHAHRHA